MDVERAIELLTELADGVNPLTGEVLPESDSCDQVEIVRALNVLLRAVKVQQKKEKSTSHVNAGKPWTREDEEKLCEMFSRRCPKKEILACFQRSPNAIAARLVKLGKIQERDEFRRYYG